MASGWGCLPLCKSLICPVQPEPLARASHRDCNSTGGRSWGDGNNSHTPESDIAFLTEKVIASAEEIKHHNETTIKRGPSLTPWITNIADAAPSPAGCERSGSDSANTGVAPGNPWRVWLEPHHKFAPSQASQLSPNFQCLGCLFLGFISVLRKRVRGSAVLCAALKPVLNLPNLGREQTSFSREATHT